MHVMIYVVRVEVLVMQNLLDEVLQGPSTLLLQSYTFSHAPVLNIHWHLEHTGIVYVQRREQTPLASKCCATMLYPDSSVYSSIILLKIQ
jgi:hypothetical protein